METKMKKQTRTNRWGKRFLMTRSGVQFQRKMNGMVSKRQIMQVTKNQSTRIQRPKKWHHLLQPVCILLLTLNLSWRDWSPATRYVPPHLRVQADNKHSEEQIKLTRQIKGLLNRYLHLYFGSSAFISRSPLCRMSEQNITTILDSVEETYRSHRRHGKFCSWVMYLVFWIQW